MKKIKQGGMLGMKLRRERKISILRTILMVFVLSIGVASYFSTDHSVTSNVIAAGGSLAVIGAAVMSPEEKEAHDALLQKVKEIADKQNEDIKKKLDDLTKLLTKEQVSKFEKQIKDLEEKKIDLKGTEEFKALALEFSTLATELKSIKEKGLSKGVPVNFEQLAFKALQENKANILKSIKQDNKPIEIELKYPETITEDNTILDGDTFLSLTENTGIFSGIRRRATKYLQNVSTGSISTRFALWFEEVASDGKPYFIHEKETKAKEGFKIVEKTEPVKKVAVRAKMSMEWLEDLPQFVSFLKNKLGKSMDIEIEDQLIDGTGGTGSDEPLGARVNAVAFTGGSAAGTVLFPNAADVIRALVLQVEEAFGIANAIFVHPSILFQIDTIKTEDGLYTRPFWATNNELIAGIKVISTMAISADDFFGGDMTVLTTLFRNGMTIRIGETGDDFQENKQSILLEQRLVQFISANDFAQVVKGTFAAAETLLNKSVVS